MPWYRPDRLFHRRTPIPVVRLSGVIGAVPFRGGLTLQSIETALASAFAVKRAPVVALAINSPGGSPVQSSLIARRIRDLATEHEKPVIAFVEDVAASGGYWLALAADQIIVDRASILGSIGVISAGFGLEGALQRLGIERRVHATGPRKALLDPFRPEEPGDIEVLKELHQDILQSFKAQLEARRGAKLRLPPEALYSGRVWSGDKAIEHGLADGLGELRSTLRARHGEEIRIAVVNRQRGWLQRRLGRAETAEGRLLALLPELLGQLEADAHWRRFGL